METGDKVFADFTGRIGSGGNLLKNIEVDLANIQNQYAAAVSPFKQSAHFMKAVNVEDAFVLTKVLERKWELKPSSSGVKAKLNEEEKLAGYCTRAIDIRDHRFVYCFGYLAAC